MTEKNPFKKDDGFIEILKSNPKIKDLSESNYKQFIRKNSMPNDTQPTTSTYLKLVHFITKNAFVSTIVMLLLLGTLGVSAAQVFAPEGNKPSSLLGGKKSSSSTSSQDSSQSSSETTTTANSSSSVVNLSPILQADSQNDVSLVERCDLQFKYPKDANNQGMKSKKYTITKNDTGIELFYEFEFGSGSARNIYVDCDPEVLTLSQYESKSNNALTEDVNGIGKPTILDISSQDLCTQIGLTYSSCDKITNTKKIIKPTPESSLITYFFSGMGKTFRISSYFFFKDDTNPEFAAKYITKTAFQFNSLSEPKMNPKLPEISKSSSSIINKSLVKDNNTDIAVFENYNLALKFDKNSLFNKPSHLYPTGGGGLPGITISYNAPNNKAQDPNYGNKYYHLRYYCWSESFKDAGFSNKPETTWQKFITSIDNAKKINSTPFFTELSKSEIQEVYENNNPYGNLNERFYYFYLKNGNYCELNIQHGNGNNVAEAFEFLKQKIILQFNSISPSQPSYSIPSNPSAGY